MSLVMRQLKLYARLTLLVALALVVATVVTKNWNNRVTVWFFGTYESINVLWLMLCTAAAAIVAWWILSMTRTVWRDLREMFRMSETERTQKVLQKRADELTEMEKRIDRKLKNAIEDDDAESD